MIVPLPYSSVPFASRLWPMFLTIAPRAPGFCPVVECISGLGFGAIGIEPTHLSFGSLPVAKRRTHLPRALARGQEALSVSGLQSLLQGFQGRQAFYQFLPLLFKTGFLMMGNLPIYVHPHPVYLCRTYRLHKIVILPLQLWTGDA